MINMHRRALEENFRMSYIFTSSSGKRKASEGRSSSADIFPSIDEFYKSVTYIRTSEVVVYAEDIAEKIIIY